MLLAEIEIENKLKDEADAAFIKGVPMIVIEIYLNLVLPKLNKKK